MLPIEPMDDLQHLADRVERLYLSLSRTRVPKEKLLLKKQVLDLMLTAWESLLEARTAIETLETNSQRSAREAVNSIIVERS